MADPCIYEAKISEIATDLKNLKENFNHFKDNDFHEIKKSIDCISDKLSKPRLPMLITWILTICASLITALIVLLLK